MDECIIHGDLCHLGCFINREGSFQCVCNAGFKLSPEGRNCMGELRLYDWADCWCAQGSSDLEQVITIAVSLRGSAFHIAPSSYPFSVPFSHSVPWVLEEVIQTAHLWPSTQQSFILSAMLMLASLFAFSCLCACTCVYMFMLEDAHVSVGMCACLLERTAGNSLRCSS